ncbi:MAG: lactate dehydrogenase [Pelobium sp.]
MKAVVFSTQSFEKELLAKANNKKHEITLIANPLTLETAYFAEGKEVVIVSERDHLSEQVILELQKYGISYISNRTGETHHIDRQAVGRAKMKIAIVLSNDTTEIAKQTIKNLDNWQAGKCTGNACACANSCQKPKKDKR